jgi:hypothetical protein
VRALCDGLHAAFERCRGPCERHRAPCVGQPPRGERAHPLREGDRPVSRRPASGRAGNAARGTRRPGPCTR